VINSAEEQPVEHRVAYVAARVYGAQECYKTCVPVCGRMRQALGVTRDIGTEQVPTAGVEVEVEVGVEIRWRWCAASRIAPQPLLLQPDRSELHHHLVVDPTPYSLAPVTLSNPRCNCGSIHLPFPSRVLHRSTDRRLS
jgi:hypothetical protein